MPVEPDHPHPLDCPLCQAATYEAHREGCPNAPAPALVARVADLRLVASGGGDLSPCWP